MSATLLRGDCLTQMKKLPDKSIDLFICDLPYGQLTHPKVGGGGLNKRLPDDHCSWDIKLDLTKFWTEVERLAKDEHTPVIHFCNTKFGIDLINSKPNWFRYDLVWNKERGVSFLLANKMPMKSHEMIYVFSKAGTYYNRVDITGEFKSWKAHNRENATRIAKVKANIANENDGTTRCALSVINIRKPNTLGHPTEKPKELYEWLLKRYCPPGGKVLDPTAGSFNSVIVAKSMGLHAIGIEMEYRYFNTAVQKVILEGK